MARSEHICDIPVGTAPSALDTCTPISLLLSAESTRLSQQIRNAFIICHMKKAWTRRIRDPVHGLIVFRDGLDRLAWKLLDTPEFQRLRRIKQLGVSDFVFPGATHTRFAHCIGVFHIARRLMEVIKREIGKKYKKKRAEAATIAALLHDIGHGPFSHTFEAVQKSRGIDKEHETWTKEIITNLNGAIKQRLEDYRTGLSSEVAEFFGYKEPEDIYHAVVSSSFDADRLDYLRRDRLMTGTGAGAIDFDWLLEHVRVHKVDLGADDAGHGPKVETFCLHEKALPAAEAFLLARYTLHEQIYFHKTTRCVEHMIAETLRRTADYIAAGNIEILGLRAENPLVRFFSPNGSTLANYLALDDVAVTETIDQLRYSTDDVIRDLASRLRNRELYKTLDIGFFGSDPGTQVLASRRIENEFKDALAKRTVLKDEKAGLSIYSYVGGDDEKAHKKLRIVDPMGHSLEIPRRSKIIDSLAQKRQLVRYYFANESDRDRAKIVGASHG